jgi:inorganic pyrophosphatase
MIRDLVDVIVEVPRGSRNKYEFDTALSVMRLTRQLPTSLVYPGDYGFIPGTEAEDGDSLDALVLIDEPTFPGCCISVVPLGVMWMTDEHGRDSKILGVLPETAEREGLDDITDLPLRVREEIEHFFTIYKDLEPDKSSETDGFDGRVAARAEIAAALDRFTSAPAAVGG